MFRAKCFVIDFSSRRGGESMVQKGDFSCICGISTLEHTCPKNLNRSSNSPRNSASFDTKADEKKVWHSVVVELETAKKSENLL